MDNLDIKDNAYGGLQGSSRIARQQYHQRFVQRRRPIHTKQQAILLTPFTSITTSLPQARAQVSPPTMVQLLQQQTTPFPVHRVGLDLYPDSTLNAHRNTVGPITGYNGFWVYGQSEVAIENNTVQDTAKEPIQIGEYH